MAEKEHHTIDQGTNVSLIISVANSFSANSLHTCECEMRKHYTSTNAYIFTCNVLNSSAISLTMNAAYSANVPAGRYLYDVELISPANVTQRVIEGIITVTPEVTR